MARRRAATRTHRALCYIRCSTEEQATSHAGLDAQRTALEAEVTRRGWTDVEFVEDAGQSGKDLDRPQMTYALAELAAGRADTLIAAKVDRLSRSVHDFSGLVDQARREGWSLITLDIGIDTGTAMGSAMATISAVFAQLERRAIQDRTAVALAEKKKQGVHIGRPVETPREIRDKIANLRAEGRTFRAIADTLNAEKVPTIRDGKGKRRDGTYDPKREWHASSVWAVDQAEKLEAELVEARQPKGAE